MNLILFILWEEELKLKSLQTRALHAPVEKKEQDQCTREALQYGVAFASPTAEHLEDIFVGKAYGHVYARISNPTVQSLEKRIVDLDEGLGALGLSSGMAAVTGVFLTLLTQGDHVVVSQSLFGGSYDFFKRVLPLYGIEATFVPATEEEAYEKAIRPQTKALFLETIGNPRCDVPALKAIGDIAKTHKIPFIVDNTLATPVLCQPKKWGADIVVYSSTKYISGHGQSVGGLVVDCGTYAFYDQAQKWPHLQKEIEKAGPFAFLARLRWLTMTVLGMCLSPFSASLQGIGLDTLALRIEKHCENALHLAQFFKGKKELRAVCYPGLEEHPNFQVVREQFGSLGGGLLTIRFKNKKEAFSFINQSHFVKNAANLGDAKTLIIHPASTIYASYSEEEQKIVGVDEGMVRISVGLEKRDDLLEEFDTMLSKMNR